MEVIGQFLATACSTIFGTVFMFYLIALAFDWMSNNKSLSLSRGVLNFSLKVIGAAGKGLVLLSIPLLRNLGEKIVYVVSHYLDKNKQPQQPTISLPQEQSPLITDTSTATTQTSDLPNNNATSTPTKKKSDNPYENPAEPEFVE